VKEKPRKSTPKRREPRRPAPEVRSDKLTAAHVASRLHQVQEDLADTLYEFRYLRRFSELDDIAYLLWRVDEVRARCEAFAETGTWEK
jgi:hypothetical protein